MSERASELVSGLLWSNYARCVHIAVPALVVDQNPNTFFMYPYAFECCMQLAPLVWRCMTEVPICISMNGRPPGTHVCVVLSCCTARGQRAGPSLPLHCHHILTMHIHSRVQQLYSMCVLYHAPVSHSSCGYGHHCCFILILVDRNTS